MNDSAIIDKIIKDSGYSKTAFAKAVGISKSYLFNVLRELKPISEPMYNALLSSNVVLNENKKLLERQRYSKMFGGEEHFDDVLYFLDRLKNIDLYISDNESVYVHEGVWEKWFDSNSLYIIGGEEELYEIVSYFGGKLFSNDEPFFYSNFSFDQKMLSSLLYTLFSKRDYKKDFDFAHFVLRSCKVVRKKLDVIFESIKWGNILLNTYVKKGEEDFSDVIFPYYIISSNCVITFSEDCTRGLATTDKKVIEYYKNNIPDISEHPEICNFIRDDMEYLKAYNVITYKDFYNLCGDICCGFSLDRDMLHTIAHENLENIDYLIEMLMSHYNQDYFANSFYNYHSMSALQRFASSGDLRFISDKYVYPLSPELRIKLLENIRETIANANENKLKYKLFNKNKLDFSKIAVDVFHENTMFTYNFDEDTPARKNGVYKVLIKEESAEIFSLLTYLNEYITKSNFLCPDDLAIKLINELIIEISKGIAEGES